ncbi:MAG TPA: DUF1993 family protein, partial [Polyangiaceae bacterium]|nr:DUF1993 family protein [Polyangiaceae bacterium]
MTDAIDVAFHQYPRASPSYHSGMSEENRGSMPLSAYDLSAGMFARGLNGLKTILTKGEAHAAAVGKPSASLLEAQLANDMNGLAVQVHWAAEGAKLSIARLLGITPTASTNQAKTMADLRQRIDDTLLHLGALAAQDLELGLTRVIEIEHR